MPSRGCARYPTPSLKRGVTRAGGTGGRSWRTSPPSSGLIRDSSMWRERHSCQSPPRHRKRRPPIRRNRLLAAASTTTTRGRVEKRAQMSVTELIAEFEANRATTMAAIEAADEALFSTTIRAAGGNNTGPLADVLHAVALLHVAGHVNDIAGPAS